MEIGLPIIGAILDARLFVVRIVSLVSMKIREVSTVFFLSSSS